MDKSHEALIAQAKLSRRLHRHIERARSEQLAPRHRLEQLRSARRTLAALEPDLEALIASLEAELGEQLELPTWSSKTLSRRHP